MIVPEINASFTSQMDDPPLNNFRLIYHTLSDRVQRFQQTQTRDIGVISRTKEECLQLLAAAERVRLYKPYNLTAIDNWIKNSTVFSPDEYRTLCQSVDAMVVALDGAYHFSSDSRDSTVSVMEYSGAGGAGRPRIEFDPTFLSFALEGRGPTDIAHVFGCSARTVRRRALELNILNPGQAPFSVVAGNNGDAVRIHNGPQRRTRISDISDNDLDAAISRILRDFPRFGRRLIDGRLLAQALRVPRSRIRSSYIRIRGHIPSFGRQPIARREYHVAGVNSLWHHDGQHGERVFAGLTVLELIFFAKVS